MKIREITTRGQLRVQPEESVQVAATLMRQRDRLRGIPSLGDVAIILSAARFGKTLKHLS